jgi:dihydroorotate dehydrogenase
MIATNSTTSHSYAEEGGLTGQPLRERSTDVIRYLYGKTGGKMLIVGVGGIASGEDAYEKIRAGASLIQVYTGLIYEGPTLVKKINQTLVRLMERDGYSNIQEAVGSGNTVAVAGGSSRKGKG